MPNSVIHVSDETHAAVKRYCREIKVNMSGWASRVLAAAVADRVALGRSGEVVGGRQGRKTEAVTMTVDPWLLPPFWEKP
jgi:hypothetical protein